MKKEKVLILDNKKKFLKIFGKELNKEMHLVEDPFLLSISMQIFKYRIFVVYNNAELTEFLNLNRSGPSALFCLLDSRENDASFFLKGINDLFILQGYKTNKRIIKELKLHFSDAISSGNYFETSEQKLMQKDLLSTGFYKAVVFF